MQSESFHACFASDNCAPVCPEAMEALRQANSGCDFSYGEDRWTAEAAALIGAIFETDAEVFFVFNGTAGNALSLGALCRPHSSVICHESAHIENDECGAPVFFTQGARLCTGGGADGKLTPDTVIALAKKRSDVHFHTPAALSLTQATEFGTVYTREELSALGGAAKHLGLRVHMDGARFANAVVSLGVKPREVANDCDVDVLVFGGTKNGLALGEVIVFFNKALAEEFGFRRKQGGQLASKMRFLSAPWVGVLKDGAWLRHAEHANRCAELLALNVSEISEVRITQPRQANAVFISMSDDIAGRLRKKGWHFHYFIGSGGYRFMCSWHTTEKMIEAIVTDLKNCLIKKP